MAVVSFERNFIFIKTKKTASTSMEIALSPSAGTDAIITPLALADEAIRYQMFPDALPRNYTDNGSETEEEYRSAIRTASTAGLRSARKAGRENQKFFNHMSARLLQERLPAPFWQKAFKFTIERHPYEKVVSRAYFRMKREGDDLTKLIDDALEEGDYVNFGKYTIDGAVAVDTIIRYEELADGIREVELRLGIEIASRMPAAKADSRTDRRPANEVLNARQKAAIRERCAKEFELLGYEA